MTLTEEPSAKQWLFTMMDSLNHDEFIEIVVTLWAIWYARRRLIHEGKQQSPLSTFMFVRNFLTDLALAPKPPSQGKATAERKPTRWQAPPPGLAKINVDAATSKTGLEGAMAAVCRDDTGLFLGASSLTISGGFSPATLEAMACREALALAQDLGLTSICVASDCLNVVMNLQKPYAGEYSMITTEIKKTASSFVVSIFRHESRSSNGEAHQLARSNVSQGIGRRLWLLNPPDGLCIPLHFNE
jgi:ribonuclease HI